MSDSDDTTQLNDPDFPAEPAGVRETADYSKLDDPAFLDERARLRKRIEHEPADAIGRPELERVYEAMTEEFLRRARIAWTRTR